MSDPTDILNFTFDAEFEPTKFALPPEGTAKAIVENFEAIRQINDSKAVLPVKYSVIDPEYLEMAKRPSVILTYELWLDIDESGRPKAPVDADDKTNNDLRRFLKTHGLPTNAPLQGCIGKEALLTVRHAVMMKDGAPMLDDAGEPRMRERIRVARAA